MIRRPPRSTHCISSAASDVYKRQANKLGARWVVLLTEEEARRHMAQLKEMVSGEQAEVAWADLPARIA